MIGFPTLKIDDLTAPRAIFQGGMSVGISLACLAAAVANEGGIGVIGTAGIGMLEPDFARNYAKANERALRKEIKKARHMTKGIIGVNILVALSDYGDLVRIAVEEGVDMVLLGAGLPLKSPSEFNFKTFRDVKTKIFPIVSSHRAAQIIFQHWAKSYDHIPDGIVVEGPLAGGHLGFKKEHLKDPAYSLEKILPDVISAAKALRVEYKKDIPVIAAGGIFTGADIYNIMKLGVQGVQMATRFIATAECDASDKFKQAIIDCREEDLVIIDSPVGMPGRAVRNKFLIDVLSGINKPFNCPWKCLRTCDFRKAPYCIALALTKAKEGYFEDGFAFAGANAYRVNEMTTVKSLMDSLVSEYFEAKEKDRL